ncbi:hypothetical protein LX36DRAFT_222316 [Colletotrichum falcatum]|nr:hypothetical protein LX36DRAFT_222316 [Colletotrichum falcatum]
MPPSSPHGEAYVTRLVGTPIGKGAGGRRTLQGPSPLLPSINHVPWTARLPSAWTCNTCNGTYMVSPYNTWSCCTEGGQSMAGSDKATKAT